MGATQGKSKKEQKEAAREWAITKENEVAELYAQNTELRNQILMMHEDIRALRDMLKGQQSALNECVKQMNERMTEMENDVKVVPFEFSTDSKSLEPVIGKSNTYGDEYFPNQNVIYDGKPILSGYGTMLNHNIAIGVRVMSLSHYEKIYEELGYTKYEDVSSLIYKFHPKRDYLSKLTASQTNFDYAIAIEKSQHK